MARRVSAQIRRWAVLDHWAGRGEVVAQAALVVLEGEQVVVDRRPWFAGLGLLPRVRGEDPCDRAQPPHTVL